MSLTADRLRQMLDYDEQTGVFRWKVERPRTPVGSVAGYLHKTGYVRIAVDGQKYSAHRLAWLHVSGEWPAQQIDHRDLNKANNAWDNLRLATLGQNAANRRPLAETRTGKKGVEYIGHLRATPRPYWARIMIAGRRHFLGAFETAEQAHAAYVTAAKTMLGEFARTS